MSIPPEVVNFLLILAGVVWRTVRPWLQKYNAYQKAIEDAEESGQSAPDPKLYGFKKGGVQFKKSFLITGAISFASIVVIAMMLGALQSDPAKSGIGLFMWAVGQTEVINREIL
jgi:hypothetical protein